MVQYLYDKNKSNFQRELTIHFNSLNNSRFQAVFRIPDPNTVLDERLNNLIRFVQKVEKDLFCLANSRVSDHS